MNFSYVFVIDSLRFILIDLLRCFSYILYFPDYLANLSKRTLFLSMLVLVSTLSFGYTYVRIFNTLRASQYLADGIVNNFYTFNADIAIANVVLGAADENVGPIKLQDVVPPYVTARSVFAVDKKTNAVLFEQAASEKLAPASTAKLMTALVSLDLYEDEELVTVPSVCTTVDSTKAWLPAGDVFKFKDLLNALLISSAGDAACTLSTTKLGYDAFVDKMNQKALALGMSDTHFSNPIGLDGLDNSNYSTAADLYKLAYASMQVENIRNIVSRREYNLASSTNDFKTKLRTTNLLLNSLPGTVGIKTGTTQSAGEVFVYEYSLDNKDIVIIVMGSKDRFTDTKNILNWVLQSYSWEE